MALTILHLLHSFYPPKGLRERSNVEKRRRSIERKTAEKEASETGAPLPKKQKRDPHDPSSIFLNGPVPDFGTTIPLSLSMKPTEDVTKEKKDGDDDIADTLPPNAIDENGKIIVTNYDILFGRGEF